MARHSRQREMILEYLKGTKAHPTPEMVHAALKEKDPELGIATVYRNLKALSLSGHIIKLNVGEASDRYDADVSNHYHFLCERCGEVSDIYEPEMEISFKGGNGAKVSRFTVYGIGVCKGCLK